MASVFRAAASTWPFCFANGENMFIAGRHIQCFAGFYQLPYACQPLRLDLTQTIT